MAEPNPYQEDAASDDQPAPRTSPNAADTRVESHDAHHEDEDDDDTVEDPNASGDEGGVS